VTQDPDHQGPGKGENQIPFLAAMAVPLNRKMSDLAREKGLSEEDVQKAVNHGWAVAQQAAFNPFDMLLNPGKYIAAYDELARTSNLPTSPDFTASIVNVLSGFLGAAVMFGADNLASGFGAIVTTLPTAVKALARGLQAIMEKMGMTDLAKNLDTSGDPLAFFGSIMDVVVDERVLTQGALPIAELLRYENRLQGIRMGIVLVSFIFSMVVEVASLGQVDGFIGLLLHIVDEVAADASRVVSTVLIRKAVADPFTDFYTEIHRTKDASPAELEAGLKEGLITEAEMVTGLAKNGYKDEAIQLKTGLARAARLYNVGLQPSRTKPAAPSVIEDAVGAGWISPEIGTRELALQGFNDTALKIYWNRFTRAIYSGKKKAGVGPGPSPGPGEGILP